MCSHLTTPPRLSSTRRGSVAALSLPLLFAIGVAIAAFIATPDADTGESIALYDARLNEPSPLATWPWPRARRDMPYPGVTHWLDHSSPDGTYLDLLDFDFTANPHLRWGIYDQDEDDARPFDNQVRGNAHGVGWVIQHLNARFRRRATGVETGSARAGRVIAACNGAFYGYGSSQTPPRDYNFHVAPVVIRGQAHYTRINRRWTFGVNYRAGRPVFKVFHMPTAAKMTHEFDFAAGGVQCLIRDGRPLHLQPYPRPGDKLLRAPVPSTPQDAGHIPGFDHMKTSRVSWAWTHDQRHLYLLVVTEPDNEMVSLLALQKHIPRAGGWMVSDVQRFWLAMHVWCAINSDGGAVAQMAYLRSDGNYEMVPPRSGSMAMRQTYTPTFTRAPQAGTVMYYYVSAND
jgi:hypothetical protein